MKEFARPGVRRRLRMPAPVPFPEEGRPEATVLEDLRERLSASPYDVQHNFAISYSGPPHSIARDAAELAEGSVFVEWADEIYPGTYQVEKEAVRMMGSLLGAPDAVGFITSGGTESNISAMRLARDIERKDAPEIVIAETAHFSFRLAAELLDLTIREVRVDASRQPDLDQVRRSINSNTVALVCSAPEGDFGVMDPVADFSDLAQEHGLYLHVDAAFGGFILPFMRDLGFDVPAFDLSLPGVSSIMTDGHKLGLLPVTTGFFLVRNPDDLDAIPTEDTLIHTITSTKNGRNAAAAWAVLQHLGRRGYRESVKRVLDVVALIANGIESIEGVHLLARPFITVVNFTTSDSSRVWDVYEGLRRKGWGATVGEFRGTEHLRLSVHPHRDEEHAAGFLAALEETVRECGV